MFFQYFSCFLLRDIFDFCLTFVYLTKREDKPLLQIAFSATGCLSGFHLYSGVVRWLLREPVPSHTRAAVHSVYCLGWGCSCQEIDLLGGLLASQELNFIFLFYCSKSCSLFVVFSQSVFVSTVLVVPRRMVFMSLNCFTGSFLSK